jgi:hypothetical protein
MRSLLIPKIAVLALTAFGGWAHGVTTAVTLVPSSTIAGLYSATFQVSHGTAGSFFDGFSFVSPVDGQFLFTLDSFAPSPTAGVYFQGYEFNGATNVLFADFPTHVQVGPLAVVAGPQLLSVGGVAAPALGVGVPVTAGYSGSFTIQAAPAVPEPQSWALMVGGLLALAAWRAKSSPRGS